MDEIFIERLEKLIKDSGKKYDIIAQELGFRAKSTISKYANGHIVKIGPSGIAKLANYFKVSPSWLAGFTDDKYYNMDINKDIK